MTKIVSSQALNEPLALELNAERLRLAEARRLLALVRGHRMKRLLKHMLDPEEFLSDYGIRPISKYHAEHPYSYRANGMDYLVNYEPGESSTGLFGGNSNWRGPIWFRSTSC